MTKEKQLKDYEKVIEFYIKIYKDRGVSEDKLREVCYKKTEELFKQHKDNPNFNIIKDIKYDWFIKNEITRTIIDNTKHLKVDTEMVEKINKYLRTVRLLKDNNTKVNKNAISEKMNISLDELKEIEDFYKSLDK
ncbi:MAG: hypothetical protein IKJ43_04485 [Bacilli bacterium]|nr:hypothetical protein [Bacilli bacterium]